MCRVMKDKFRRITAVLLVLSIMWTSLHLQRIQGFAENRASILYEYEGYQVQYTVINAWEGGQQVEIAIRNTGTEIIRDWEMKFEVEGRITNIWNAVIQNETDKKYFVKNEVYNAEIPVDGSVCFGYTMTGDSLEAPKEFVLAKRKKQVVTDMDIKQKVVNDWGSGVQVEIEIMNPSDRPLENWELVVESNVQITNLWNAEWIKRKSDNRYIISALSWNHAIPAGGSVNVGLTGIKDENQESVFNIIEMTEIVICFESGEATPGNATSGNAADPDIDTDGDKLPDYLEKEYGCDVNNPDTDGDGLPDGYEVLVLGTDPLLLDSDFNEIPDGDEDFDEDGLSNIQEYAFETSVYNCDTDGDGLNDSEEINIYFTNPIIADSDGDGIIDGDEVALGLAPNNKYSSGILDSLIVISQTLKENEQCFQIINQNCLEYQISMVVDASGKASNSISIENSVYSEAIENNSVIGNIIDIKYSDLYKFDSVKLQFRLNKELIAQQSSFAQFIPEFNGIHRFIVFKYDEESNLLLPIETTYNESENIVCSEVNELGTFCVLDFEKWLYNLGYMNDSQNTYNNINLEKDNLKLRTIETLSESSELDSKDQGSFCFPELYNSVMSGSPNRQSRFRIAQFAEKNYDTADIVFVLQGYGQDSRLFQLEKEAILSYGKLVYELLPNVNIRILYTQFNDMDKDTSWIKSYEELEKWLDAITYVTTSQSDVGMSRCLNKAMTSITYREEALPFVIWVMNGMVTFNSRYEYYSPEQLIYENKVVPGMMGSLYNEGDKYSLVYIDVNAAADPNSLTNIRTDVIDLSYDAAEHFYNKMYSEIINLKYIVTSNGLKKLPSDFGRISKNSLVDYDGDGLKDSEEINFKNGNITIGDTDIVKLPILYTCIINSEISKNFLAGLNNEDIIQFLKKVKILPIISDPTQKDSDKDQITDYYDNIPLSNDNIGKMVMGLTSEDWKEYVNYKKGGHCSIDEEKILKIERLVTIVQESLEYLGYLNLYDEEGYFVGYGIFGGKTRAAIQLFQINHNIRPLNNKEFLLDENTVATIVLDAVLNGLTIAPYTSKNKQYQYCMNEFDIDYAYRDKIIKVMRNLDEYMLKAGVDYKETKISPYECVNVFDYTCVLEKVRQNADINFHKEYYMCEGSVNELAGYSYITYNNSDKICIRDIGIIRELGYMYSNVKAGAKYDIKDTNRWNELIAKVGENIYYYGNCFEFMYKGKIITAEDFGNILYGSYGNAAGFSLSALEDAGSLFSRINDGHFDYPEDTANITLGYNIFNENKYDYNYLHE